jgi:hypothetical protein
MSFRYTPARANRSPQPAPAGPQPVPAASPGSQPAPAFSGGLRMPLGGESNFVGVPGFHELGNSGQYHAPHELQSLRFRSGLLSQIAPGQSSIGGSAGQPAGYDQYTNMLSRFADLI